MPFLGLLLILSACSDGGTGPMGEWTRPILAGTVHPVDGGSVEGLWAVWRSDGAADSARVDADGSFELRAPAGAREGELLIDGPGPRAFHPFLLPLDVGEMAGVDVLLVPRTWTLRSGTYRGRSVPTPLDPVVDDDADQLRYSYFFGQPEPRAAPERYLLELMAWPAEALPARVAFDHAASEAEISAADSAEIWAVFEGMEASTGLDLFEPAVADPDWWSDDAGSAAEELEPGVIRVIHSPPAWRGLPQSEEEGRTYDGDLGAWATDGPFDAYRERHRRLEAGALWIGALEPLRLADGMIPWQTVLIHEMAHVLGVGHTCRIPSPMGPCLRTADLSERDVAYMELLRETLRMARELDAAHGVMQSVVGERRILLDDSALPRLGR